MSDVPDLVGQPERLEALRRLHALDTPSDEGLDQLAELARTILGVPVSLVSLVDENRQFFKSCLGLDEPWCTARETPLSHSFCRHTIAEESHLAIDDARSHPLVADNPAIEDLGVVAYLGIPLVTHDGQPLGSLCAIDHEPRAWTQEDVLFLRVVADSVIRRLELTARLAELEQTRAALREREVYFRALIERGAGAVSVLDRDGRILYSSPNTSDILGVEPQERIGRSGFERIHPDDLRALRAELERLVESPEGTTHARMRYHHPEKGWLRLEGIGKNLIHEPAVGGIVFNYRDVTKEWELEEGLRERQKLETVGELTAGIAHDFNNLLAVVTANAELLEDALVPENAEGRRDLDDLRAAARGGAELIRSLMTFSRRDEPSLRPTDVREVVEQAARMLRRILPSRIKVEWEAPEELPLAQADPRAVEQILLNLATNARDAMPDGGVLSFWLSLEEEAIRLRVRDTGKGMDEETLERAFQPFFTTKEIGKGTGLGLAMVQRLIARHGGTIDVESIPKKGTTFDLRFRVASSLEEGAKQGAARQSSAGGVSGFLLVVEDEEALRRTAKRVLERAGYQVVVAPDGKSGLEVARSRGDAISLVISDQDMPAMSGMELLRALRDERSTVPFILTTGFTARELTTNDGMNEQVAILPKPWTLMEVERAIAEALSSARPSEAEAGQGTG